jgi:membrane-associated phospholipid phosphatase
MNKEELLALDRRISEWMRLPSPHSALRRAAALLAHTGDSWYWAVGLAAVWVISGLTGDALWHRNSAVMVMAVVFQALFVFALKSQIRRQRPSGESSGIYRQIDPHSFPSGHATRAMLLIVLAIGLGPPWFAGLVLVWAPLMAISRVLTGDHYISDIVGGMVLGLVLGLLALAAVPFLTQWLPFLF